MKRPQFQVDDLTVLINRLPKRLADYLQTRDDLEQLIEIILDLGYPPEVRFSNQVYRLQELGEISADDLESVIEKVGQFNTDNRAGIERTLHRVSAIRNRTGKIIGLTCRIGRAVAGTAKIIADILESGHNCLLVGPPGIGKTTLLRETARMLAESAKKRVIIVDTSNEIAGDGDIPHPSIGHARRMQVPSPDKQHAIMIEAVENHMPEVIVVDEIGTEEETRAARTIAERGVQLVATAHGYRLDNLIKNPVLAHLLGGIQSVIIGDEEAKFRGTSKTVLERKGLPTFDVVIEIQSRNIFAIYNPVAAYVDAYLKEDPLEPEVRVRNPEGGVDIEPSKIEASKEEEEIAYTEDETLHLYPYGISIENLNSVIHSLQVPVKVVQSISDADMMLTLKAKMKNKQKISQLRQNRDVPLHVVRQAADLPSFFRKQFHIPETQEEMENEALREAKRACKIAISESRIVELSPRPKSQRHVQHQEALQVGLNSMSVGEEPNRRVRVYPRV